MSRTPKVLTHGYNGTEEQVRQDLIEDLENEVFSLKAVQASSFYDAGSDTLHFQIQEGLQTEEEPALEVIEGEKK